MVDVALSKIIWITSISSKILSDSFGDFRKKLQKMILKCVMEDNSIENKVFDIIKLKDVSFISNDLSHLKIVE